MDSGYELSNHRSRVYDCFDTIIAMAIETKLGFWDHSEEDEGEKILGAMITLPYISLLSPDTER